MPWLFPVSCILMVRVASQGLKYSVDWGLSLGFLKYLLEKQLNLGVGAGVACATGDRTKPTKAQPSPLGEVGTAGVLGVGWGAL